MSADTTNAEIARLVRNADTNGLSDADLHDQIKRLGTRPAASSRALSIGATPPERKKKGPRLRDDPRYLAGVRALARRTQSNARIVGGDVVAGTEFDDCVAVGGPQGWGCTGTLIAPDVVLTAGHCEQLHTRIFIGNNVNGTDGREIAIRDHVRHQDFTGALRNDLMLLFLARPVKTPPRAIADATLVDQVLDARVVGFGTTDLGGTAGYGIKRRADVPVVSQRCRGRVGTKSDSATYGCYAGLELVAGKPLLQVDTCRGDSGGPLYVQDAQRRWLLAGVTSRGTDQDNTETGRLCGDGGNYVRVHEYRAWIESEIKKRAKPVRAAASARPGKASTKKKNATEAKKTGRPGSRKATAAKTAKKKR